MGISNSNDSGVGHRNLANRGFRTHFGIDRCYLPRFVSVVAKEEGNASLGFALTAPLLAVFTAALLILAGSLWQRELAFSLLERAVVQVARGQSAQTVANEWRAECLTAGLSTTAIRWSVSPSGERKLLRATSVVQLPSPVGASWQVEMQATAVVE